MCGRFAQAETPHAISERFGARESAEIASLFDDEGQRFNVAPTQLLLAVTEAVTGQREVTPLRWGLVPAWAKDPSGAAKCINARAETISEKPTFRSAFKSRRCVVPATAYYEWQGSGKNKQPFAVRRGDGEPLVFAGLWEEWTPAGREPLRSCTIVTTAAGPQLEPLHHRMPAFLTTEGITAWLTPTTPPDQLQHLLASCSSAGMEYYPVSRAVGNVRSQGPELLEPIHLGSGTLDL